jgi:hypothetical protein
MIQTGAQQAEHDLQFVTFAVAAVAASRQRTAPALEPSRADLAQMALYEAALDAMRSPT